MLSKMAAPPVYREITFYFIQFTFLVLNFDADNVFKCTLADFLFVLYLNVGSICKLLMFTHFPCYLDRENHVHL